MRLSYVFGQMSIAVLILAIPAFGQTWSWGRQVAALPGGGDGANRITGITVNPGEDIFIVGDYSDSVLIGGIKVVQPLNRGDECYVAKVNSSGSFAWAKGFGSQYFDNALDITSDPDGNSYVAVDFEGTLDLDSLHLNAVSIASVGIAKYNSNGGVVWARLFWNALQGPGGIVYYQNHIYAAISRTLIKYTTDGDTVWVHTMPEIGSIPFEYNDIAIDSSGNIVATGSFSFRAVFGSDTVFSSSVSDADIFVAKFDEDGVPIWAAGAGAALSFPQVDVGRALTIAPSGEIYVVGKYKGTAHFDADSVVSGNASTEMFIAKYASDGHVMWVKAGNGPSGSSSESHGVQVLANNDVLVTASYTNRVTISDTTFTVTIGDVLMLRLSSDGIRRWGKRSNTAIAGCTSHCLATNIGGTSAYAGGQITSNATFGPSVLTIVGPAADGWVAKMDISTLTDVREITDAPLPKSYLLSQNYPNPFNPTTSIDIKIPATGRVNLEVLNILGEHVRNLVDQELPAGYYTATWDGRDERNQLVSSGVYFYRLHSGSYVETHKMTLLK